MFIRDVMTHPPVTCPRDVHLDAVVRLMSEYDCGMVLIVDDGGHLAGVVTDRDICLTLLRCSTRLDLTPVAEMIDSQVVFSCRADDSIECATNLMRDLHIRRVPVTDAVGRPVGVLSIDDLASAAHRARLSSMDREFVEVLADIVRPARRSASRRGQQNAA